MPLIPPSMNPTLSSSSSTSNPSSNPSSCSSSSASHNHNQTQTQTQNQQQQEWATKLLGKTISDTGGAASDELSFAKQDLPREHRIVGVGEGDVVTMDWRPERLNVHLGEDGTVRDVRFG